MDAIVKQVQDTYSKCIKQSVPKNDDVDNNDADYDDEATPALATCKTLLQFLKDDKSSTFIEYTKKMTQVTDTLKQFACISEVDSVSEIFTRFTTLRASEFNTMDEARRAFHERGELFLTKIRSCKDKLARNSHSFISDGNIILVHSNSPAVVSTLLQAKRQNKQFSVYVTRCVDNSGIKLARVLLKHSIKTTLIPDSAIGYYMEKINLVLVGAEGVVENGGIINMIGTYPLALCAKTTNKPFYVVVESYKFLRLFPIRSDDIPEHLRSRPVLLMNESQQAQAQADGALTINCPSVDYTPPGYITLLLTDLGPLTTAAVSDVLINLYL